MKSKILILLFALFICSNVHAQITENGLGSGPGGVWTIGSGLDYDTVTAFEADIGATLTGHLTGEHNDEETTISTDIVFNIDTNGFLLKLTAQAGDEHDGILGNATHQAGDGARITYTINDSLKLDEITGDTLINVEISNLVLDAAGSGNEGILIIDCGQGGLVLINRNVLAGDGDALQGIAIDSNARNTRVINNIIYDFGDAGDQSGIFIVQVGGGDTLYLANNTVVKNYNNFSYLNATQAGTLTTKNNIAQDNTGGVDFSDAGGGFGTTGTNVSEDATSPDVAYRNTDLHTNTIFNNYANDDYKLDSGGDSTNLAIVDDGENLFSNVPKDIIGQDRDDGTPFWIGASHIVAGAPSGIPIFRRRIEACLSCHDDRFLAVNNDVFCPEENRLEFAFND